MILLTTLALTASLLPADSVMWQLSSRAWENPAVKQWMMRQSHSSIEAGYENENFNEPIDVQQGTGSAVWQVGADTYMKYKTSTLWGGASYSNGKQHNVRWNETSDIELIYPYVTADSIGGDINVERYSFAGGYADHNESWAWGAEASYLAGLYFRNVDPRPRNVTGQLELKAGVGYKVAADYFLSFSVGYMKYKQSSDIDFKNQVGVEKIYHLTGLGSHYYRFSGLGLNSYYDGDKFSGVLSLYPEGGKGLALTATASRFTFKKVLTELNKLPLIDVWHNEFAAQASWLAPGQIHDWAFNLDFHAYRRHGRENIFGDPASSIYPQIALLDMYADNMQQASLSALWQFRPSASGKMLWVKANGAYSHRAEAYASPHRRIGVNNLSYGVEALFSTPFGNGWRATFRGGAALTDALDCSINLDDITSQQPAGAWAIETYKYHYLSSGSNSIDVRVGVQKQLDRNYMLALQGQWNRCGYTDGVHSNYFDLTISLHF